MNDSYYFKMIEGDNKRDTLEKSVKNPLSSFDIEPGNIYLLTENSSILSLSILNNLASTGYKIVFISRTPEKEFRKRFKESFHFKSLEVTGSKENLTSIYESIEAQITESSDNKVFLIEDRNQLIMKNSFEQTLHFIYRLNEITHLKSLIIMFFVETEGIDLRNLRLLEKETKQLDFSILGEVPEEVMVVTRNFDKSI
ncbi:MAG: DUF835 domain-containing protein [Candidatus Hodarchaeales archaeon]|jgi:hypothetical protein